MAQAQQAQPQSYRWVILTAACIIGFMLVGARETLGNFLKPITGELHWDRETISLIAAINLWLSGLLQPFTGHIMDRFGAKWLFAISVTLYGAGVLLVSFTHTAWYLVIVYGVLVGSATAGSSISLSNALVAQWFPAPRRAFAISVNNACVALGRLALLTLSFYAFTLYGWRWTHIYLGAAILLVTIPAALVLPGHRATTAHRAQAARRRTTAQGPLEVVRWSEALRTRPLWQIMGGYFVCGMTVGLSMHFIAFATDHGYQHAEAVVAQGTMAVAIFCGSLLTGINGIDGSAVAKGSEKVRHLIAMQFHATSVIVHSAVEAILAEQGRAVGIKAPYCHSLRGAIGRRGLKRTGQALVFAADSGAARQLDEGAGTGFKRLMPLRRRCRPALGAKVSPHNQARKGTYDQYHHG